MRKFIIQITPDVIGWKAAIVDHSESDTDPEKIQGVAVREQPSIAKLLTEAGNLIVERLRQSG